MLIDKMREVLVNPDDFFVVAKPVGLAFLFFLLLLKKPTLLFFI